MRKNKVTSVSEVDIKKIECAYSPAKRRGPPPKHRTLLEGMEVRGQDKKQRRDPGEHSISGLVRVPEEISTAANIGNMDATAILNLLGMLNPAASTSTYPWQNQQGGIPPPPPPPPPRLPYVDPVSAALLSSLGSAFGIQGMAANAQIPSSNPQSNASHQLAYLQQLQQQLQQQSQLHQLQQQMQAPSTQLQRLQQQLLQQQLLQQQQQHLSQQGQTTRGAESSMSSSVEDTKNQSSLKSEVERLLIRVNELETENASLTQKVEQLQMREE